MELENGQHTDMFCGTEITHTSKSEIAENTASLSTQYAPVLDLCEPCVAVHLGELELGLCAHALW